MRYSLSIAALALLHGTNAMNAAKSRQFGLLADMGLNPDGTPMDAPSADIDNPVIDTAFLKAHKSLKIGITANVNSIAAAAAPAITPEYVELPIDNFAKHKNQDYAYEGTFFNRYWVSSSGYKAGGPVFVYDVGEADAEPNALFRLQNETSFFKQLVDQFAGIGIVWEHRFYGNSTPTPIDINTPPEAFEFLTTEQSLADVDHFAKQFTRKGINATLTPDKTPWVFVGGSYPGMRAAFMRNMYPDTIYASWASSAPVQASVDQSFYFDPVWRGMNAKGFGNCTKDIQAAVRYMDKVMDTDQRGATKLKQQFLGLGAEKNSHATFADALSTIFYVWQSYGIEGGASGLRRFCDYIETDPGTKALAPKEGWAKGKGAKWTVDRWASYAPFVPNVNSYLETECSGKMNVTGNCDLDRRFTDPAMISWTWQYCSQWGMSSFPLPYPSFSRTFVQLAFYKQRSEEIMTDKYNRILPIRQPWPPTTNQQIQLPHPPTRHLPPPIPYRPAQPPPRLARHSAHQRRLRRLVHPPLKHLLVQRRIRPLAHPLPRFCRAVRSQRSNIDEGDAKVWEEYGERGVIRDGVEGCGALF
jgi:hypothetical protein